VESFTLGAVISLFHMLIANYNGTLSAGIS